MKAIVRIDIEASFPGEDSKVDEKLSMAIGFALIDRVKALAAAHGGKVHKISVLPMGVVGESVSPMDKESAIDNFAEWIQGMP